MPKPILIFIILSGLLINGIFASDSPPQTRAEHHLHSCEPNQFMVSYQFGYTNIRSKNNHMPNDSGVFLGIHLMKPIENSRFNSDLYLAAGAHTTFSEDKHLGLMLGIMYPINEKTMLSIMPGLMFMKHEASHSNMGMGHMIVANDEWETEEAIHIEVSHTITLFNRILNPSFGWMSSSSHNQYSLGLNFHF